MTHQWDGDDRDDTERIDHVSRSRAVRGRRHVACADLRKKNTPQMALETRKRNSLVPRWRNTYGELHVHEHGRNDRQDVVRVRDGEIGEERDAAVVELLEWERAEALDGEEHAEGDGELREGHQEHGEHADAGLVVHAALLERDALHRELVARLVRAVELLLELQQARLVRREHGRVAQLLEGEREEEQPREERARDERVEPRQARRDVQQLEHP